MRKLLLLWIALLAFGVSYGQSITNYAFSYSFTGSLEDMSSGTTSLMTGINDDAASSVVNIGFPFNFMGVSYTQFSANSNGQLRLGSTAISSSGITSFSSGVPILAPMAGDNEVYNGIVYKVIGSAPNRILIVQWTGFYAYYTDMSGSGNMQVLLYESSGKIEYKYGNIYNSNSSTTSRSVFISSSNTATTAGYITIGATPTFTPAATPVTNTFAASVPIANLASATDGNRTVYTWTPTVTPTAPTSLTFSAVTSSGMTLNWTDSPDELSYAIFRSIDGVSYTYITSLAANTVTYPVTGLSSNTMYYWKVCSVAEALTSELLGSQITNPAATYYWVGATGGNLSLTTNWNTAADGSGSDRATSDVSDILIVDGDGTTPGGSTTINVDVASFSLGQFKVTSNTNLTLQSSTTTTRIITLIGGSGDDFVVENGSTLNLNNATMAVAFAFSGAGLTGDISGTYNAAASTSNVINTTGGTGTLVTVSATGVVNNTIVGSSGCLTGSVATLTFANGSNYTHSGYTTSNGYIPLATWGASSNIFIAGGTSSTAITNAPGQTFGNFTYNSATSTGTCSAFTSNTATVIQGNLTILNTNAGKLRIVTTGTLNINGSLIVAGGLVETSNNTGTVIVHGDVNVIGGTFDVAFASTPTLKVAGNFIQTGGNIIQTSANGLLEFNGTSAQALTVMTGVHGTNAINVRINNPAGVVLTNDMSIRNLTVSNGNLAGTGVLSFNGTTGLLTYNGTNGAQISTATEFPAVNGPSSLTINNTSASPNNIVGIPFSRRLAGTSGVLTLTSGIIVNPTYVLSVSNTAVSGISGGSATSYVAGGLERDLPASLATGTTYNFPVGKSKLNQFALVNPTTNSGGTVTVLAEVVDGNCSGTPGALLQSLKTNRYWVASISNGGANFTSSLIQLNDSIYGADAIAASATVNGTYDIVGGLTVTSTATSLTSTAPESTTLPGFYVMANKAAPVVDNVAITPTGNQCTNVPRTVTATVTPGGGAITGVVIQYNVNGVPQTPVVMTNVSVNDWSGIIPTVTPVNATVTWSIEATDANLLIGSTAGTPYTDEPNYGITINASASETTVCSGNPVDLSITFLSSISPASYTIPPAVTYPTTDEDLGNVTISEGATTIMNNTSTRNTLDGTIGTPTGTAGSYSNYTSFGPFSVTAGTLYNFSVSTLQGSSAYNNAIGIYIDYNRDGDFGDAGENVYVSSSTTSGAHTETGSFTIPASANYGLTRMRVIVNEGLVTGPTMTVGYGEYEEYMLNISSSNFGGGGPVVADSYEWSDGSVIVATTNPATVNPTVSTNYTGTAVISGCPVVSNTVSVTTNPLPSTPTANNSTQCGVAVPTCSVTSTSGAPSPVFNWYDVATGGTPLAGITGNTYTGAAISTTTYFYVAEYNGTCESERVMVTANVGAAPALTLTADQTICNNGVAQIDVTSNIADFDSYVWTPDTALFTDAACATPYVSGSSATTVYFKTSSEGIFTLTCSSNNSGNGCSNVSTTNVTVAPASIMVSASETEFCNSGVATFSAIPSSGWGDATFQWMDSPDNVTFSDIVGANTMNFTNSAVSDTTYFKLIVEAGSNLCTESNVVSLNVKDPEVLATTPDSRCGIGSVSLQATGSAGTVLNWYDVPTGGTPIGTGSPWSTPVLSTTTTYYAAAEILGTYTGDFTVGTGTTSNSSNGYPTAFGNYWRQSWQQYVITAAELQAAGLIAGNINAISFNLSAVPSPNTPPTDYQISLGTTSNSTLSAWTTTGLTTVFGPATPPTITTGWNTITFSAPYAWDGVSNILVDIRGTELYGSANAVTYNTTTSGNTTLYAYTTTSNPSFWTSDPTPSTSTSRMNTRFNGQGVSVCASPRTAVVATIGAAPALSITPDTSICNNAVLALNVTSNLSDFDSYVWTPEADLYTDAACTTPYTVGANASTVYLKSTTAATTEYFCSALNSGTGCTNMDTVEVTVLPAAAVASASPDAICVSGSSVIDVTPNTGFGTATFQWMESTDNVTFSDVVGANATSYSTPVLTDTTYYKLVVEVGSTVCLESSVASVIVHNPSLLTAVTDSVCGDVPATLTATTDAGYDVYWFSDALGTNLLSTGSPFVTPDITAATTYYVAAGVDFAGGIAGAPNTGISASLTSQTSTTSGINFDVLATEATIHSVDIYPTAAIGSAFTIRVSQGGTTIATYSGLTTVSGSETTPVVMTVPVEFTLPAGTGYLMTLSVNPGVIRNSGGDAFPYTIPGYLTLTSSTLSGYYYYLYNWNATSGCLSALTPLTVEHTTAPAITVTASAGTICQGESTNVSASSSNAGYTYTWQAGALSGATQSVSPTTDSTFNVVATDNSGGANDGCIANGSVSIVVNPVPVSLSIDVSDNSICAGETIDLFADAVSGDLATDTIFAESFENAGTIPAGWVAALDVDGNATNAALTYPTTTSYPSGFNAYDGTYLVRFNSYSVGVGNSARLSNSTGFPTTGYDQVDVTFAMMRDDGYSTDNDNVALQYSTDGTTWYTLGTPFSRYSAAGDAWEVKSVTLPDSLENLSTLYIAFLFTSAYGNDVYIDYVNVKGYYPAPATYEWTSVPAGFTSTQQNPMGVAPTVTTQYTVAAFNSYGCSLTADTTVTVNPIPSVYLGADQDICDTTTITLDAGNPGSTFNWSTGGSAQTESILGADLGAGANVVSVTVTSAAGCIGYDEVTITVTVCDGIEDPTMHISYYPNPATDMLNLDLSELPAGDYRFEMFNMQGQKVMDRILVNEGNVILVNLLDVAPGSYVISVNGNNNSFRNYLTIQE